MTFGDPIVGGNTLIRDAIQSQDYVLDVSGWAINADGSAQFFNVTIIGDSITVNGSDGSMVQVHNISSQARIDLTPPPESGHVTSAPAQISAFVFNPDIVPVLGLMSPQFDGLATSTINLIGNSSTGSGTSIQIDTDALVIPTSMQFTRGLVRAYIVTHPAKNYDCTLTLNLGGAAAPIAGCTTGTDLNGLQAGARWKATLTVDSAIGATAGVTNVYELSVDGATLTTQCLHATGINTRLSVTKTWSGTFAAAGNHTIAALGRFVGGGGVNQAMSPHTSLQVEVSQ
jgi:hypothetical protein